MTRAWRPHCCTNPWAVMYATHVPFYFTFCVCVCVRFCASRLSEAFLIFVFVPRTQSFFHGHVIPADFVSFDNRAVLCPFVCCIPSCQSNNLFFWYFFLFLILLFPKVVNFIILVLVHFNQARLGESHVHLHHRLAKPPTGPLLPSGRCVYPFCMVLVFLAQVSIFRS